ncbi:hemin uptake protein HemP [Amaricoccus sp.]|uniref:hemin uptake protein HemP n=1 Tax=Amaricoccus sp. TaxID=1872485 RepID=UPI0039E2DA8B
MDRDHAPLDGFLPHPRREPVRQAPPPVHDARLLTGGGNEAEIRLDGVRYVLRITRQGKLILTK